MTNRLRKMVCDLRCPETLAPKTNACATHTHQQEREKNNNFDWQLNKWGQKIKAKQKSDGKLLFVVVEIW